MMNNGTFIKAAFDSPVPFSPTVETTNQTGVNGDVVQAAPRMAEQRTTSTDAAGLADAFLMSHYDHGDEGYGLRRHQGMWLAYQGKAYEAVSDEQIEAQVVSFLRRDHLTRAGIGKTLVNNIIMILRSICHIPDSVTLPARETANGWKAEPQSIVLQSGILDLSSLIDDLPDMAETAHTPRLVSLVELPFQFDPAARCDRWLTFLEEVLPNEGSRTLLRQMFGYCLTHETRYHKFFILEGPGANGKSVVLDILQSLLGPANVSQVPLEKFGNSFSTWATYGKLANIVTEIGDVDKFAEGQLKAFTSGDTMLFERKYRDPVSAVPTAKLVFATNVLPLIRDKSDGIWRRMLLLEFHVTIPEHKIDSHLTDELRKELPGIFSWAVSGAKELERQGKFIEPAESAVAKREYRLSVNPIAQYLEEHCIRNPGSKISTAELYASYRDWSTSNGFQPSNRQNLSREVVRTYGATVDRERTGQNRRYYFYGIAYQGAGDAEKMLTRVAGCG